MKAVLRTMHHGSVVYQALMFCCPGCAELHGHVGLHVLPVNTTEHTPAWEWDRNLDAPTLAPSILTRHGADMDQVCHSYLRGGVLEYLADSTHSLAGQSVPLPNLPDWVAG